MPLPVVPRRGPRLGIGGTLAVVGMVALLGTGFGVLGGRPGASPSPPVVGVAPSGAAPSGPAPSGQAPTPRTGPLPEVTPYVDCAEPPTTPPVVQLQVNGRPVEGFVELMPSRTEPSPPIEDLPGSVPIPVDVISELWVVGGACATSWDIGLFGGDVLNQFVNPSLDPGIAAQNRFGVLFAPYAGRDALLRADLFFPDVAVRAIWRIAVAPFERPIAYLHSEGDPQVLVEGCDSQLVLGNGYEYPRDETCTDDLPFEPRDTLALGRNAQLVFGFIGGWDVENAVLRCGRLSGTTFVGQPQPGCFLEPSPGTGASITFPALPQDLDAGVWLVAISACATSGSIGTNHLCGSWYAKVEVHP